MIHDARVAGKYALALFNVALKRNELDAVESDLASVAALAPFSPRFGRTLASPMVNADFKRNLLVSALKGRVTATTFNTLNLMLDKGRIAYMDDLTREFSQLLRHHRGIVRAVAWTAVAMEPGQVERLTKQLSRISGKTIELDSRIDPGVIAGAVVNLEDKVLDGSVRHGLDEIRETLMKVRVL